MAKNVSFVADHVNDVCLARAIRGFTVAGGSAVNLILEQAQYIKTTIRHIRDVVSTQYSC